MTYVRRLEMVGGEGGGYLVDENEPGILILASKGA